MKSKQINHFKILMLGLVLLGSRTALGISQPTHVYPHSSTYLAPGVEYPFRMQSHENNCIMILQLFVRRTSDPYNVDGVLFATETVTANNKNTHYQRIIRIPYCPIGSEVRWRLINIKNGNTSSSVQSSPTTAYTINSGTNSGIELRCGVDPWIGIRPKTLTASIENPAGASLGIYYGITNWYHYSTPTTLAIQTSGGIAFKPTMTSNPNQTGTYLFRVPSNCIDNIYGQAVFLRIPSISNNLPAFNGFLINPDDVVCPDYIACRLRDVTYYELPTLLTLTTALPGVTISNVKWYYQNPDGSETLNGKTTNGGSYSFLGNTYLRKKVCYSHLLDDMGVAQVNEYRGEITYSVSYIDPLTGQTLSATCVTSINATVTPVDLPISLSETGQSALNNFKAVVQQLDDILPIGIDPCDLLGVLGGLPVLGITPNGGEGNVQVLEHCRLPTNVEEGYYSPSDLQSIGIDPTTVTYGWYKDLNRLANQNILQSIQMIGKGTYIRMMEINGLATKTVQEVAVIDCMEPITFAEEAAAIATHKQAMEALGYDMIAVAPSEEEQNSFTRELVLVPVEKTMVQSESEEERFSVQVYPNPATASFNIKLNGTAKDDVKMITIKDASGRLVETIYPNERELSLGLISHQSILPKGLYFIETIGNSVYSQQRLIIQ